MKSLFLSRYALNSYAAAAMLARCGGLQPRIGAPDPMPQTPSALYSFKGGDDAAGSLQAAQSCSGYTKSSRLRTVCRLSKSGAWYPVLVKVGQHRRVTDIYASFFPDSGNPTELKIAETHKNVAPAR